ncbi:hypothetical protein P692DRAFT_20861587 [Suillus brevipes Sb2]|nr:hypothetical protein P692DRAFT_20861587 [Suillus brevipes Sb2]
MLSPFARHLASNLPVLRNNVLLSSVLTSSAFAATRRTFFTTRRIQLPAAASKSASTTTTKKTTATKAAPKKAKATTKAKSKPDPKKAKATAKAKSKPESTATAKKTVKRSPPRRVPKSERPPSRPLSPYFVFFLEHYKKRKGDVNTAMDARDVAKESSVIWKNLTIAEKQPYYDEAAILRKQYEEKQDEYWKNASPKTVREINARRKHEGRQKIHRPQVESAPKRPKGPYMRFWNDFRQTDDGRAILEAGTTSTGIAIMNLGREAGQRWRAMSASDKAPYVEAFQKARTEWDADHSSKSASASASS